MFSENILHGPLLPSLHMFGIFPWLRKKTKKRDKKNFQKIRFLNSRSIQQMIIKKKGGRQGAHHYQRRRQFRVKCVFCFPDFRVLSYQLKVFGYQDLEQRPIRIFFLPSYWTFLIIAIDFCTPPILRTDADAKGGGRG